MASVVAFLRAINVGGRTVTMEALRRQFETMGLDDVETFIASGNVIFSAPRSASLPALERRIEKQLQASLGYEVKTFLRTSDEVAAIAGYRPFKASQLRDARSLNVAFLGAPLDPAAVKLLMAMRTPIDEFHLNGREMYWLCRGLQSESTFSNARFEKATAGRATFRGLNTIVRLAKKYSW
jgi:uncharacterized protein (DUF1697 family)